MQMLKPDRNKKLLEFSSVIVRIHDNQREFIPDKGFYGDINNQYLPYDKMQRFTFDI